VQHDVVRQLQRRADDAEWDGWIEHHQVGTDLACHLVDPAHHPRVR
jgi:hypothetical protein